MKLFSIDRKCPQCFKIKFMTKTNKSNSDLLWWTFPPSKPTKQSMSLHIENSFSEPPPDVRPRPPKGSTKHPTKSFFSSKFLIWFRGLPRRRLPPKINARCNYRPPIKNMTAHYNSPFCVSFHFCFHQEAQKRL